MLWGVYGTESSFGKDLSTSSAGAEGPFQFEPGTARSLGINPHDFVQAAHGAARYLAQFKGRGLAGMLSAYNAGPAGGIQHDYVSKVLANAKSWGSESGGAPGSPASGSGSPPTLGISTTNGAPDPQLIAAIQAAMQPAPAAPLASQASPARPSYFPKLPGTGNAPPPLTPAPEPSIADKLAPLLAQLTGGPESKVTSSPGTPANALTNAVPHGTKLNGFLPGNAPLTVKRKDQGQDIQTAPNTPILAPGSGYVKLVQSDPNGFGIAYPIVHFTSGPLAGHDVYIGHTRAALKQGAHFTAGETLSHTQNGSGPYVGNATGLPGWAEIGLWTSAGPPAFGAGGNQIAPLLGLR